MTTRMTVAQLIEKLRTFDQDVPVMIECADDFYIGFVRESWLEEGEAYEVHANDLDICPEGWVARPLSPTGRPYETVRCIKCVHIVAG